MIFQELRINPTRLISRVERLGKIGALEGGGVCRLALTPSEKLGRDHLVAEMKALGLDVAIDPIGNIFGARKGRREGPAVMLGSHIDTVATGGLYDGALGVLAGLEVIATLNEGNIETDLPVVVAAFTNEEGARFAPDMLGSLVFVGGLSLAEALDIVSIDGKRLGEELEAIGYAGTDQGPEEVAAYFELHIEQGPVLEDEKVEIGAVLGVQGISWTELTIRGRSAHAGTTPIRLRRDAGLAAARIAAGVGAFVRSMGGDQVGTVGASTLTPNLVNVVAETAVMTVDLRNPDEGLLQVAEAKLTALIEQIAGEEEVTIERRSLARFEPVDFAPALIETIDGTARVLGFSTRRLFSGAGHDAQMLARIAPAAMIFVPSVKGISHNITEYTEPADLANGANVLLQVTLKQALPTNGEEA
ncbi:Zn-dependent hydrolase [Rhizobium daejeonense]|uniref:Zn-dependent hydrolase n=1 Tax=Rhizobium daejeonense TaxID=240521 RepID=A0A6M1S8G7_9HYPH|nr:Zn-dependent hydrolase [Rhizobium daejeonense]NGO66701.1 Zn-dependent hydrolase [Rhizobium daejeonense]